MAEPHRPVLAIGHPAPLADRVWTPLLFIVIGAGPLFWLIQLLVGFAFPSYLCFRNLPRPPGAPTPGWMAPMLATVNIVGLAVCVAAFVVAVAMMRRTHQEHEGSSGGLLDAGEGRTRYLAVWGAVISVLFFFAIGFNTINLFLVPLCSA